MLFMQKINITDTETDTEILTQTEQEIFNPEQAMFMDFSVEQKGNTRFMYVLPTSKTEALLEYTLFSHSHLETSEYESEIELYIQKLGITNYKIVEKERGSIPMTCFPFWKNNTKNILNIGVLIIMLQSSAWLNSEDHKNNSSEFIIILLSTLVGMDYMISAGDFLMLFIPSQALSIKATIGNNHIGEKSFFFTTFGDSICVIMRFQTVP